MKQKVRVGILIIARMGSKRLKDKHFLLVNGEPLINFLVKRIKYKFSKHLGKNYH